MIIKDYLTLLSMILTEPSGPLASELLHGPPKDPWRLLQWRLFISLSFSKDYIDLRQSRPFLGKISALFTGFQSSFPNNAIFSNSQGFQTISWPLHNFRTVPEVSHGWHYMFWACSQCMLCMCMHKNVGVSHSMCAEVREQLQLLFWPSVLFEISCSLLHTLG